jgi:hypothetical protein
VLGYSASAAGLVLIAFISGATLGSMAAGRLMIRIERYKRVPVVAIPFAVRGAPRVGRFSCDSLAWGSGGAIGTRRRRHRADVIIQNAVLPHQFGIATGSLNFFRTLGGAIIVAIFAAIVLGGFHVPGTGLTPDRLAHTASSDNDFAEPFRRVFIAAAAFLASALVAVATIEGRPLHGPARRQVSAI